MLCFGWFYFSLFLYLFFRFFFFWILRYPSIKSDMIFFTWIMIYPDRLRDNGHLRFWSSGWKHLTLTVLDRTNHMDPETVSKLKMKSSWVFIRWLNTGSTRHPSQSYSFYHLLGITYRILFMSIICWQEIIYIYIYIYILKDLKQKQLLFFK
jgi:hypothetical protein